MKTLLVILVVSALALQYRLWFSENGILSAVAWNHKIADQKKSNQEIVKKNVILATEIINLQKSPLAIENRARNDLGMVKPDEVFYQVIE